MGVIKGLGRGQLRGVTGREGFELEEEEEEKDEEDIRLGNVLLSPLQSPGKNSSVCSNWFCWWRLEGRRGGRKS